MSIVEPLFWEYLIFDDEGTVAGIRKDAPEERKREYQNWLKELAKAEENGIKL